MNSGMKEHGTAHCHDCSDITFSSAILMMAAGTGMK
jgi:hypothetical protein